jgi:hypothetical protein
MADADEYRRFADQCLGQAFQCENTTEKKGLIQMARTWALLADKAGEQERAQRLEHQLRHANKQLALTRQYPGRGARAIGRRIPTK